MLKALKLAIESQRSRATYYQQRKSFPPPFVRRFFLRYPHAHLYIAFWLCASAMVGPVMYTSFLYATMSKEEFERYKIEQNAVVRERQKFGKGLWFPFLNNRDAADEVPSPKV